MAKNRDGDRPSRPNHLFVPKMQVDEQNERMVVLKNVGQAPC